jgi:hypothetical protein
MLLLHMHQARQGASSDWRPMGFNSTATVTGGKAAHASAAGEGCLRGRTAVLEFYVDTLSNVPAGTHLELQVSRLHAWCSSSTRIVC